MAEIATHHENEGNFNKLRNELLNDHVDKNSRMYQAGRWLRQNVFNRVQATDEGFLGALKSGRDAAGGALRGVQERFRPKADADKEKTGIWTKFKGLLKGAGRRGNEQLENIKGKAEKVVDTVDEKLKNRKQEAQIQALIHEHVRFTQLSDEEKLKVEPQGSGTYLLAIRQELVDMGLNNEQIDARLAKAGEKVALPEKLTAFLTKAEAAYAQFGKPGIDALLEKYKNDPDFQDYVKILVLKGLFRAVAGSVGIAEAGVLGIVFKTIGEKQKTDRAAASENSDAASELFRKKFHARVGTGEDVVQSKNKAQDQQSPTRRRVENVVHVLGGGVNLFKDTVMSLENWLYKLKVRPNYIEGKAKERFGALFADGKLKRIFDATPDQTLDQLNQLDLLLQHMLDLEIMEYKVPKVWGEKWIKGLDVHERQGGNPLPVMQEQLLKAIAEQMPGANIRDPRIERKIAELKKYIPESEGGSRDATKKERALGLTVGLIFMDDVGIGMKAGIAIGASEALKGGAQASSASEHVEASNPPKGVIGGEQPGLRSGGGVGFSQEPGNGASVPGPGSTVSGPGETIPQPDIPQNEGITSGVKKLLEEGMKGNANWRVENIHRQFLENMSPNQVKALSGIYLHGAENSQATYLELVNKKDLLSKVQAAMYRLQEAGTKSGYRADWIKGVTMDEDKALVSEFLSEAGIK